MLEQFKVANTKSVYGMKSGKILSLENVSVSFKHINAVSSVQLDVNQGEILFITGASGAGKTTLLRLMSGEIVPSKGRRQLSRNNWHISRVFQDLRLIENYTGEMNLLLSFDSDIYRNKNEFIHEMIELAEYLKIKNRLGLRISDANGGLRQKIALLRALLSKPDLILLDEPTSSLDYENSLKVFELLNLYNIKKGLTIVWASHDRSLIRNFSGRIVHLDNGRLIHAGHACFT